MEIELKSPVNIKSDLCRLARFGANISDSHSCFIFLPSHYLRGEAPQHDAQAEEVDLAGCHSLSNDVLERCRLPIATGIIGWVATHQQSIHVSPFEHDSRTLGMYRTDQKLKSFIGIPIRLEPLPGTRRALASCGVIACDSKKCYAFSKLQGKLLEDLAYEISNTLRLSLLCLARQAGDVNWHVFLERAQALQTALNRSSIDVLRVSPANYGALEHQIGSAACAAILEQIYRLVQQALPPHFPAHRLPNGDILIVLDNMMSSFYQNKIEAFAQHVSRDNGCLALSFSKASFSNKKYRNASLEELISATALCGASHTDPQKRVYEYGRA